MSFGYSIGEFVAVLKIANDLRNRFIQAPKQYNAIVNQVDHLWIILNRITRLDDEELREQQEEVKRVARDCQIVLEKLQAQLDKFHVLADDSSHGQKAGQEDDWKDGIRRAWNRVRWDQGEIDGFQKQIESNISMCNLLLSKINQDLVLETRQVIVSLNQRQDDQERRKILSWLSPIDPSAQQNEVHRAHQEGTGTWLLRTTEFQNWVAGEKVLFCPKEEKVLFCPGIPGAGKTILSSVVINHLERKFVNQSDVGITYFFCNYRQQQTCQSTFSALLRQLIRWQPSLPGGIISMHKEFLKSGRLPSEEDIYGQLVAAITSFSKVFLIIDALDECPIRDGVRSVRGSMIRKLLSLCEQHKVQIFTTSRPDQEIAAYFLGGASVEIQASRQDIERYVDVRMDELCALIKKKPELKLDIKSVIVGAAKGMFLLARLYFNLLLDQVNIKHVEKMLERFHKASGPDAYQLAYDEIVQRIDSQSPNHVDFAKRTIGWITNAKRPLTVTELEHAIAIEIASSEFDQANITNVEQLTSFCCGLVIVDEQTSRVKLVHLTTQKYFESISQTWLAGIQETITNSCITYISYDAFADNRYASRTALQKLSTDYPLYVYAAMNLGHHFKDCSGSETLALKFLQNEAKLSNFVFYFAVAVRSRELPVVSGLWTGFHAATVFAAAFGLSPLLQRLLEASKMKLENDNPRDPTPLFIAAAFGHHTTVKLLLDMGADPAGRSCGRCPIHMAAAHGHDELVELFLENGVDVDVEAVDGRSPLLMAAGEGRHSTVELLLARGANKELRERREGATALLAAAERGHETIVRLLLSKGANVGVKKWDSQGILHAAVRSRKEELLKFLFGEVVGSIESGSQDVLTPLCLAVAMNYQDVTKLLLERGAMSELRDAGDAKILYFAAENGHERMAKLLFQRGAALDPGTCGPQPLPPASLPTVNKRCFLGIRKESFVILSSSKLLSFFGRTVFHQAVFLGNEWKARFFLELGANPDVPDRFGRTPLFSAATSADISMVKLLLSLPDVDISRTDVWGLTPADEARRRGFKPIRRMLETKGLDSGPISVPEKRKDLVRIGDCCPQCIICSAFIPNESTYFMCGHLMICRFCPPAVSRVCPLCGHRLEEKKFSEGDLYWVSDFDAEGCNI